MDSDAVDPAELRANLEEYRDQLRQVEELLLDDPDNAEYLGIYNDLAEVVTLTEEVLAEATQHQQNDGAAPSSSQPSRSAPAPIAAITQAPEVKLPSALPPQVADQIRIAQQRAALAGQGPAAWAIGARVQARIGGDGLWYDGIVSGVAASGNFIVTFEAYGSQEEVQREDVRRKEDGAVEGSAAAAVADYKGVEAPKRKKINEEQTDLDEMPKWLEIKPTDDEKTKTKKRKLMKSYKSKQRFQQMDVVQKQKADAWKNFSAKGLKKKKSSGLTSTKKKGSMFRTAEASDARVGVVGSGKGMTEYGKKKRHEFTEGGPVDE